MTLVKITHVHFQIHMQELHDMFYDMALLVEEQVRPMQYRQSIIFFLNNLIR